MDAGAAVQAWLRLDPESGGLSGTPAATLAPTPILFQVQDSSPGGGVMVSAVLSLRVDECLEGARVDCFVPNVSVCLQGTRTCSGGAWGDCVTSAGSMDFSACGSACAPCGPGANNCLDGQCACGTAAPCSSAAPTCCGTDAGSTCANLASDVDHCGSCATACTPGVRLNVTPGCDGGICTFACSSTRYQDCNRDAGDGCEADTTRPVTCGQSCIVCPPPSGDGYATCDGGACGVACNPTANFCEDSCVPETDPDHCTGCGKVCPSSPPHASSGTCTGTGCSIACLSGYTDCNNDAQPGGWIDGCETHTSVDMNNCGACGALCVGDGGLAPFECHGGQCLHYELCSNGLKCYEPQFCFDPGVGPIRCAL